MAGLPDPCEVVFEFDLRVNGNKIQLPKYVVQADIVKQRWRGKSRNVVRLTYAEQFAVNGRLTIDQRVDYDEEVSDGGQ